MNSTYEGLELSYQYEKLKILRGLFFAMRVIRGQPTMQWFGAL